MDDNFSLFLVPKQSLERGGGLSLHLRILLPPLVCPNLFDQSEPAFLANKWGQADGLETLGSVRL